MTDGMTDPWNDGQPKSSIAPLFQSGAIIMFVWFIINIMGPILQFFKLHGIILMSMKIVSILANSADLAVMPHSKTVYLGLNCL